MASKHTLNKLLLPKNRECNECDSRSCVVQRYCSSEWKTFLSKYKSTFHIQAGEEIFSKGEKAKGIYCVFSGYIKVYEFDERSERIVELIRGVEILVYRGLGNKFSNYTVSARALSECEITFFPMEIFKLAIEANKHLAFFIIDLLISKLSITEYRSNNNTNTQAKDKISCAIRDVIVSYGF